MTRSTKKEAGEKASGNPPQQDLIWGFEGVEVKGLKFMEDAADPLKGRSVLEWIEGLQSPDGMTSKWLEVERARRAMADLDSDSGDGSES